MPNETECRTKAQTTIRTRYLSELNRTEGMAIIEQSLIGVGIPQEAAAKAAEAYGAAIEADRARWGVHPDPNSAPKATGETAADRVLEALRRQAADRPRQTGWVEMDLAMARKCSGMMSRPIADFEKAVGALVDSGRIELRVVGSNSPVSCFRLLSPSENAAKPLDALPSDGRGSK